MSLEYIKVDSPIGEIILIANPKAIVALYVGSEEKPLFDKAHLNNKNALLNSAKKQLKEYFQGKRHDFDLPLNPNGTDFQQKAWKSLLKIPYGKVWSYGEQARFVKSPKASRAIGGANGANPIPIIIPCHRVVGSTGRLTGFAGGMEMKIYLLKHEGHEVDPHGLRLIKI
jgi:methylated-DNA-[protein]-cysteine S-methyltransferase